MATPNFIRQWEIIPFNWEHCDLEKSGLLLLRIEPKLKMRWQLAASATDSAFHLSNEYIYILIIFISEYLSLSTLDILS